jgi:hypothetical protein
MLEDFIVVLDDVAHCWPETKIYDCSEKLGSGPGGMN